VILGCVYIDPPERTGSDGEVSWWVVDDLGRDISWPDWLALPPAS
jgi:hypothetical protein